MKSVKVGLVGSDFISGIYLENSKVFKSFNIVACSDLFIERDERRNMGYPRRALRKR